jgi:hypothetical protein
MGNVMEDVEKQAVLVRLYKIRAVMSLISAEKDKYDKVNREYSNLKLAVNFTLAELEQRRDVELNLIKVKCEQIYNLLDDDTKGILNIDEWKYLDIVIYYFYKEVASNLADVREHIHLLEKSGNLDESVKVASSRICGDIYKHSARNIDEMCANLKLNSLIKQVALLKKCHCTSKVLWNDVSLMLSKK